MTQTFSDLLLPDELLRAVEKLGFSEPTPVQQQVVPLAMAGRDLLVSAATGSGKTAAFLLPMLQRFVDRPNPAGGTRALILVPTRELARQIYDHFIGLAALTRITAGVIIGGAPRKHQIATLRKNPELLIATPGRMLELVQNGDAELGEIEVLVLDEADRMLDMGFAADVISIISQCGSERQSMLFSATLEHHGLRPIVERLLRDPETVVSNPVREKHPDIHQQAILADDPAHKQRLLAWLLTHEQYAKALVFTNKREQTESLGGFLQNQGVRAAALHGEMDQRERNRVMGLLRSGQIQVVVATDVAARGLDISGIELVISYDFARNAADHLHRTGRTGRAGEQGVAISLIGATEWNRLISAENFLQTPFERRAIPGLEAKYQGPKKVKSSGKVAGTKKKEKAKAEAPTKREKVRERDRKNVGKRRKPSGEAPVEAGLAPPKRRS